MESNIKPMIARSIFLSVIEQAIYDVGNFENFGRYAREADSWFRDGRREFRRVCHLAGLDPDYVRRRYLDGKLTPAVQRHPLQKERKRIHQKYGVTFSCPTQKEIRNIFDYNAELGKLTYRKRTGAKAAGKPAGYRNGAKNAWYITIHSRKVKMANIMWVYHHGDIPDNNRVGYIDGDHDHRIENLKLYRWR